MDTRNSQSLENKTREFADIHIYSTIFRISPRGFIDSQTWGLLDGIRY